MRALFEHKSDVRLSVVVSSFFLLSDAVWSNITYIVRAAIDGTVVDPELEDAAVAKALAESDGRDKRYRLDSLDEKGDDDDTVRSAASSVASIRRYLLWQLVSATMKSMNIIRHTHLLLRCLDRCCVASDVDLAVVVFVLATVWLKRERLS